MNNLELNALRKKQEELEKLVKDIHTKLFVSLNFLKMEYTTLSKQVEDIQAHLQRLSKK